MLVNNIIGHFLIDNIPSRYKFLIEIVVQLNAKNVLQNYIDHIAYVEATDGQGKASHARIHFILLDRNDSPPKFKRHSYQGFMNSELTRLRNNLQVEV